MKLIPDFSLKKLNTFGLDVSAQYYLEFHSAEELIDALQKKIFGDNPLLVVGEGSNLLFLGDFKGVVIHPANDYIRVLKEDADSVLLESGSGVNWDNLVKYTVNQGWWGIENLSNIPGQAGAAAIQNIGAYGVEIAQVIQSVGAVEIESGKQVNFSVEACCYSYRESVFKKELKGKYIITSITILLSKSPKPNLSYSNLEQEVLQQGDITLQNIRNTVIAIRQSKLPAPEILGNAGSFFMNPIISKQHFWMLQQQFPQMPHYNLGDESVKVPAAWLIEQCGWKGKRLGGAGVHDKQALVIVNYGEASGHDIVALAMRIREDVMNRFEIVLVPEVNFIAS